MVGVMYFIVGAALCVGIFAGWYWLSRAILRYIRFSYPEQARDLPSSLFSGEGWKSPETKLIRAILSNKSVYYYDSQMREYRRMLLVYFIMCIIIGIVYVLYPIFSG